MRAGVALQLSVVVASIAACGGADPVVVAPAHKHLFGRHKGSTTHAADAGVAVDGGSDDGPKMVIVMPPALGRYVLLYPEEGEAVRARIAKRIATLEGPTLIPVTDDKMRTFTDRVTAGKLLENGLICARPPMLFQVVDAETKGGTDDNLLVATPSLDCDGKEACMIQVSVGAFEGEREADLMLSAKLPPSASTNEVDDWLAAADALEEVDELIGAGYGIGTGSPPPLVRAALRKTIGDFGSTFSASPALPPPKALATCHDASPAHRDDLTSGVLVSVDAAGHASKCTVVDDDAPHDPAQIKRQSCLCQAVEKTKFPVTTSTASSRRALYDIFDSPTPKKHPHKASVQARVNILDGGEGHPEASDLLDIPQLSDCFLASNPKDDATFDLKLHLAPTGKVEAVEIAAVTNQMRACLTRAYLATPFVCDMEGEARVLHAGVTLSIDLMAGHK